jgi:hypothetical protein
MHFAMPPMRGFLGQALAGFVAVTLLLSAGMVVDIRKRDALASGQVAHIRAEENEITLAERLRWIAERIV